MINLKKHHHSQSLLDPLSAVAIQGESTHMISVSALNTLDLHVIDVEHFRKLIK